MITKQLLEKIKTSPWDLSNNVLYDLCLNNFTHSSKQAVLAKTLMIGRTYAAAIERRKNKTEISDNFYIDVVAPHFINSELDNYLSTLKNINLTEDKFQEIIKVHKYLTELIFKITALEKRSLSSKYLHFHLPKLYFIYDTRAVYAIGKLVKRLPKGYDKKLNFENADKSYQMFFLKCIYLTNKLKSEFGTELSPRELDNLLMEVANTKGTLS